MPSADEGGAAAERSDESARRIGQDGSPKSYYGITSGFRTPKPAAISNEQRLPRLRPHMTRHKRNRILDQKGGNMEKFKLIMELINACLHAIWSTLFKS